MKKLTVADAMTDKPVCAKPDDTVVEAARAMERRGISSLPICAGKKLMGFVTAEDVVKRVVAKNRPLAKLALKDIMTKSPVTTTPDVELTDAMALMAEKNIKRLLVVENQKLVGILTDGDILRVAPELVDALYAELEQLKENVGAAEAADVCESCGNYSTDLKVIDGELLCEECRESGSV